MNLNGYTRRGRFQAELSSCQVCGEEARYIHYGVLTCTSCKTFFRRRSNQRDGRLRCHWKNNCVVTSKSRKSCTACRFAKCLAVGMSSDYIRKEEQNQQICQVVSKPKPLDLLSTDRSNLSQFEWRLLSNVVFAFDKFIPIVQTRDTIDRLAIRSFEPNFDTSEILNMFATFYTSTEAFIGSSADFQILTVNEKSSLYQRNIHGILNLCAIFLLRMAQVFDQPLKEHLITSVYGFEIFQQTKRIASQIDDDLIFIKLILLILAFSSNCYVVDRSTDDSTLNDSFINGTFRLWGSQNVYIELFWKYLLYRYDYLNAAIRFARMIKNLLDLLTISAQAQSNHDVYQQFVDEVTVLTEQNLTLNENNVVALWGKTTD